MGQKTCSDIPLYAAVLPALLEGGPADGYSKKEAVPMSGYQTVYQDFTAGDSYFDDGVLGFTRMGTTFCKHSLRNYGLEGDDTILHEANGHIGYQTGDEGFVRSHSKYLLATGRKPHPYIVSI